MLEKKINYDHTNILGSGEMLQSCTEIYLHKYSSCKHPPALRQICLLTIAVPEKKTTKLTTLSPFQVKLQLPKHGAEMIPPE